MIILIGCLLKDMLQETLGHQLNLDWNYKMELVALLSTGKGTWAQVSGLMTHGEWDKVILLGSDFAKNFSHQKPFEFIQVDLDKKIKELQQEFRNKLRGKIEGTETALSIASGD